MTGTRSDGQATRRATVSLRASVLATVAAVCAGVTAAWWGVGPAEVAMSAVLYPAVGFIVLLLLRVRARERSVATAAIVTTLLGLFFSPLIGANPLLALAVGTLIIGLSEGDAYLRAAAFLAGAGSLAITWPTSFVITGSGPQWVTAVPVLVGGGALIVWGVSVARNGQGRPRRRPPG